MGTMIPYGPSSPRRAPKRSSNNKKRFVALLALSAVLVWGIISGVKDKKRAITANDVAANVREESRLALVEEINNLPSEDDEESSSEDYYYYQ
ncbi:hypothetical protein ACHAWF_014891 [Thalassiosira exigua]